MSITIQAREPRGTVITESEGRLFYVLFSYLQAKAYELHMSPSEKKEFPKWSFRNHENPLALRNYVSRKVFDEFEDLCVELGDMPRTDKIKLKIISTELLRPAGAFETFSESHLEQMYKWGDIRVEGQFWFLGATNDGGVFAYLGNSEDDECIFIVKALSSSYTELFKKVPKTHPDLPYSCFETVLLPWKDCIIYHGVATPYMRYTPKEVELRHERLGDIIARCERRGRIKRSLTSNDNIQVERNSILGSKLSNFMSEPISSRRRKSSTEFLVRYIIWSPFENQSEHQITRQEFEVILRAGDTEGFKSSLIQTFQVKCGEECPLCEKGIFGICECKEKHELLKQKGGPLIVISSSSSSPSPSLIIIIGVLFEWNNL